MHYPGLIRFVYISVGNPYIFIGTLIRLNFKYLYNSHNILCAHRTVVRSCAMRLSVLNFDLKT